MKGMGSRTEYKMKGEFVREDKKRREIGKGQGSQRRKAGNERDREDEIGRKTVGIDKEMRKKTRETRG